MNIFADIISVINTNTNTNTKNSNFVITQFNKYILENNNITQSEFINYKYFVLKNYLLGPNKSCYKQHFLDIFRKSQQKYMTLCRFINIIKHKNTKKMDEPVDLQFNDIYSLNNKYIITLINSGVEYKFYIFDLIKIINTSLSYEYNFFPDPTNIKNPWNNKLFTFSNLYNIYFFIKNLDNINIPILFERFFQSNFCLKHFIDHNQFIIKNYIINNCHTLCNTEKILHINTMLNEYNSRSATKNQLLIDDDYSKSNHKLVNIFDKYLKTYLLSKFSYESDIRIDNTFKLNKQLRLLKQKHPIAGRKICFKNIIKLYFISKLHYDENAIVVFYNGYIPTPDMILIENKSFIIDFISTDTSNYSVFSQYRVNKPAISFDNDKINTGSLSSFVTNFTFNKSQIELIESKNYNNVITVEEFNKFKHNNARRISNMFIRLRHSSLHNDNINNDNINNDNINNDNINYDNINYDDDDDDDDDNNYQYNYQYRYNYDSIGPYQNTNNSYDDNNTNNDSYDDDDGDSDGDGDSDSDDDNQIG